MDPLAIPRVRIEQGGLVNVLLKFKRNNVYGLKDFSFYKIRYATFLHFTLDIFGLILFILIVDSMIISSENTNFVWKGPEFLCWADTLSRALCCSYLSKAMESATSLYVSAYKIVQYIYVNILVFHIIQWIPISSSVSRAIQPQRMELTIYNQIMWNYRFRYPKWWWIWIIYSMATNHWAILPTPF